MELLPYVAVFLLAAAMATFLISFWERSEKRRRINEKLKEAKNKAAAEENQTIVEAINELSAGLESLEEKVIPAIERGKELRSQVDSLAEVQMAILKHLGKEFRVETVKGLVSVESLEEFKKKERSR